ncbi:MAG: gliding motility lipoprotein GldD [Bacteroidota bacterium]|nr:gliding motility lipoprotein GldD [Bacteroidota bacterium]
MILLCFRTICKVSLLLICTGLTISCSEESLPKPKGFLRLDYPMAKYTINELQNDCPYEFGINTIALIKPQKECNMDIVYPQMKATIHLTYKQIHNNINELLKDAQRLTYHHTKKASVILEQPFVNPKDKVYGMFYEVNGEAASATQFYLTDSLNNFISGSVYFRSKPNADSLLPANEYIKKDVRQFIESLRWK